MMSEMLRRSSPSPLYSEERVGVRGESRCSRSWRTSTSGPSPQPSPPSTGEREPDAQAIAEQSTASTRFSIAKTQKRKNTKKFKFSSLRLCAFAPLAASTKSTNTAVRVIASLVMTIFISADALGNDRPNEPPPNAHFQQALAPRTWSFPRDHGRHDGFKTEWWYFTGNLVDESGRTFGYQLTFFRTSLIPTATSRPSGWAMHDLYFAHAAISDIANQKFLFKDQLSRGRAALAESSDETMSVRLLDWTATMTDASIDLHARDEHFSIDLQCHDGRGPILQGPGGVNAKGREPGQASYYYSMTRLKTSGVLTIDGKQFHVTGHSWMDHEFSSNALSADQVGWDWVGLSLADGNDLMIYRLRNRAGGADYLSGTLIKPDGTPVYLSAHDITLEPSNPWTSPASGAAYPQQWKMSVTGLQKFVVRSRMVGQELNTSASTKVDYFEGSAEVVDTEGRIIGEGYLEMTGYGKSLGKF